MDNLALKYRPKEFSDVTEQHTVVNMLEAMCNEDNLPNRNFLLIGPRGCGKAQPMHSLILTPTGYTTMGNLEVGSELFTASGEVTKVKDIYPQGSRHIYQIHFDDGSSIEVSDNHLNEVMVLDDDSSMISFNHEVIETVELKKRFEEEKELNPTVKKYYTYCPKVEWESKPITVNISPTLILQIFDNFEHEYFFNSFENRVKLLDAIISLSSNPNPASEVIVNIAQDVSNASMSLKFLVSSLGCIDIVSTTKIQDVDIFRHSLKLTDEVYDAIFPDNPRKSQWTEKLYRSIVSIDDVGMMDCQCIMVEHKDHTYISNDFVPTHNTTLGRIVANKLNNGVGQPIEIDAASHNGVDSMREIMQQATLYPIGSAYKVFLVDECHVLSSQAWQVMLKVLEEQPAKSIFILLTTNPEKIPATIISRVQVFQLANISLQGIENRLKYVIEQENNEGANITYDDEAISYIAKLAKGGMRDSLTTLNKALVYSNDLTLLNLKEALNLPEYDDYFDLLNAYAKKDYKSVMTTISKVYNSGLNFVKWFEGFQSFLINIAKFVFVKDINKTMIPSYYLDKVQHYGLKHAEICLALSQTLIDLIQVISKSEYMEEIAISYLCQKR